jgi:hypothetical protein
MRQRGVLFTSESRLAIREGRKTQTRRIPASFKEINEHPDEWELVHFFNPDPNTFTFRHKETRVIFIHHSCWAVGDELYIKEPHYLYGRWEPKQLPGALLPYAWRFRYSQDCGVIFPDNKNFNHDEICTSKDYQVGWYLRSPLFMPKWAARDWLRVTAVRCERLQSISEEDAMAEGVLFMGGIADNWDEAPWCASIKDQEPMTFPRGAYARVWDSINKKYKWAQNPWVVCYTFGLACHSNLTIARLGVTNG